MKINEVEFEIDFTDADFLERIEKGKENLENKIKELGENKKDVTPAEGIRQECNIVRIFIDYVFGEGSSEKAFKNKYSLKEHIEALEDIFNEYEKQINNLNDKYNKFSIYSPERLQR